MVTKFIVDTAIVVFCLAVVEHGSSFAMNRNYSPRRSEPGSVRGDALSTKWSLSAVRTLHLRTLSSRLAVHTPRLAARKTDAETCLVSTCKSLATLCVDVAPVSTTTKTVEVAQVSSHEAAPVA